MVGKMPVELDNEVALVRLVQSGSNESFGILVNRYERQIYRLACTLTKNAEDAADVLQETFLRGYANIHSFKGESRFCTWLVSIAMNEILLKLEPSQVHGWISLDEAGEIGEDLSRPGDIRAWSTDPGDSFSKPELSAILSHALDSLAIPLRAVFALRDMEGFSSEETASVLGLPLAAVTTCLARARLELRQHLSAWFENPSDPAIEQGECEIARHSLGPVPAGDREFL